MYESAFLTKFKFIRLKGLWILTLFVFSCRTLPQLTHSNIVDSLPPESNIIMEISVPGNEALLETIMSRFGIEARDFSNVSERMERLSIGLEIDSEGRRSTWVPFHIVAIGDWPKALFGKVLGKEWVKSGRNRWLGPAGLELMLISRRELIISSGKLDSMLARIRIASKNMEITSVGITAKSADLAFWLADPDLIYKILPVLPVRNFAGDVIVDLVGGVLNKVDDDVYSLDMFVHLLDPHFAESLAFAMRLGFVSQIGKTFDFLDYAFLAELDIEAREPEVVISHHSISIDLLKNFLSFDFGLGVTGFDSSN